MKRMIAAILMAVVMAAHSADVTVSTDVQKTTATDLSLYEQDEGTIGVNFLKNGDAHSVSGAAILWYGTNKLQSASLHSVTQNISSATNYVEFTFGSTDFTIESPPRNYWSYGVEVDGKMQGDGLLYVKNRPGITNITQTFLAKYYLDYSQITNYIGVADYGPYEFSAGFGWTTNADGRLLLTSTAGTPSWDDITSKPTVFEADPTSDAFTNYTLTAAINAANSVLEAATTTVQSNLTAHISDTTAAHAASAISTTGTYANVQEVANATATAVQTESDPIASSNLTAHAALSGTNVHGLGTASLSNATAFASAAQGATADTAVQTEADPIWGGVSNTVTTGAALGATSTQPADLATHTNLTGAADAHGMSNTVVLAAGALQESGGTMAGAIEMGDNAISFNDGAFLNASWIGAPTNVVGITGFFTNGIYMDLFAGPSGYDADGNETIQISGSVLAGVWLHSAAPTISNHVANKGYVDLAVANYADSYQGARQDLGTTNTLVWLPTKYTAKWAPSGAATFAMDTNATYRRATYFTHILGTNAVTWDGNIEMDDDNWTKAATNYATISPGDTLTNWVGKVIGR